MHPLERNYVGGIDEALTSFGMSKEALSPEQKAQMLEAHRARPKGLAGIQAQATAPVLGSAPPAVSGPALDRTGYQGGYGTAGTVPGATLGARGQVVGLPNKMAAFFL